MEYEHVLRLIDKLEAISNEWKERINEFEEHTKKLEGFIGRYFNSIDDQNCKQIYNTLELVYKEDYWGLFEKYKVYKR